MNYNVASWTCNDVTQWLRRVGFGNYVEFFLEHHLTGKALMIMGKEDLYYLAKVFDHTFKLGDLLNFEQYLKELKERAEGVANVWVRHGECATAPLPPSNEANWQQNGCVENVRIMESEYPDHCWRYKSVMVMIKDYMPLGGATEDDEEAGISFAAYVTHVLSPVDFFVQPAMVQASVKKTEQYLQDVYSESTSAIPRENVYVGMPCVTRSKQDDRWYRAQIVDVVGTNEAPVRFVDWGHRQYCSFEDIKPLSSVFGRIPPAALRCRIKGVRERTLEQKVLDSFHAELDSLGSEIVVKIVSASSVEPVLVEIFNKYTGENIGQKYLPKEPLCPKLPSSNLWKKKKATSGDDMTNEGASASATAAAAGGGGGTSATAQEVKVFACDLDALMEGAIGYDSSSDDGQTGAIKRMNKRLRKIKHQEKLMAQRKWPQKQADDDERQRISKLPSADVTFQRRCRKQKKPLSGVVDVCVTHVESTHEIYVKILALEEAAGNVQAVLKEVYDDPNNVVPNLPAELVVVGNACVIYEPNDATWYRCRIAGANFDGVSLQAVDVGKRFPPIEPSEYDRLKVLLCDSRLDTPPQAFFCRINPLCDLPATPTESRKLKELLPVGGRMKAEFERSREPWRASLWDAENERNFAEWFDQLLDECNLRGIIEAERRPCTDVAVWQDPTNFKEKAVKKNDTGVFPRSVGISHGSAGISQVTTGISQATTGINQETTSRRVNNVISSKSEDAKDGITGHGFANDIEAVLFGSAEAADYDSDEDPDHTKRSQMAVETDERENDKDEKGSVCDFPDEKKELVTKWLENSVKQTPACSVTGQPAPKRVSVAAMYNPDLTRKPPVRRNGTACHQSAESTSASCCEKTVSTERDMKPRLPVQGSQVCQSISGSFC